MTDSCPDVGLSVGGEREGGVPVNTLSLVEAIHAASIFVGHVTFVMDPFNYCLRISLNDKVVPE